MNHQIGKELAKYYTFTGKKIDAREGAELGLIAALVEMGHIESTIEAWVERGKPNKYANRELPAAYAEYATAFSDANVKRLLNGEPVVGVSNELTAQLTKIISYKGIIALETMNDLIDQQAGVGIDEGIELELAGLAGIFRTKDALSGLMAALTGVRPTFETRIDGRIA